MENTTILPWDKFRNTISKVFSRSAMFVSPSSYLALTISYSILITAGVIGNLLVLYLVARSPSLRTARNIFVTSLAISDFCLCLLTMPLTLVEVTYQNWQWGESPILCRLQPPLQAVFVLISSLSITAIAVDRCTIICWPSINNMTTRKCVSVVPILWLVALLIVSPLTLLKQLYSTSESLMLIGFQFSSIVQLYATKEGANQTRIEEMLDLETSMILKSENLSLANNSSVADELWDDSNSQEILNHIDFIMEEMDLEPGTIAPRCLEVNEESVLGSVVLIFIMVGQYLLPVITVSFANAAIYFRLKQRMTQYASRSTSDRREIEIKKMKRTCFLLILMAAIFILCWLPLTLFNMMQDYARGVLGSDSNFFAVFALCHLMGMLSACANPVVYGLLNENFKTEFKQIFHRCFENNK